MRLERRISVCFLAEEMHAANEAAYGPNMGSEPSEIALKNHGRCKAE